MDWLRIWGGNQLKGQIHISGAKNATLTILAATLLVQGPSQFRRVPKLQDVRSMLLLLESLGAQTSWTQEAGEGLLGIEFPELKSAIASYDLVRKMRASILVLGPLLARFHQAKVSLPGGCAIGTRPIDIHLEGLKKLGAQIDLENGYVLARAPHGLIGNRVQFRFPSVGATENLLMAAVLAKGQTTLENCAQEPEIIDLATFLKKCGAQIEGAGSSTIFIQGVNELKGSAHWMMGDRIEAATYLIAGLITRGSVNVLGIEPSAITALLSAFTKAGVSVVCRESEVCVEWTEPLRAVSITTEPFPGFPTDIQAQWMALMSVAMGQCEIRETVFENRFMHVPELKRLGAKIEVRGDKATIYGVKELSGAQLMATDLRASAGLVLAALAAKGESRVNRIYHLDRGYEELEQKLRGLGANIERVSGAG